MSDWTVLLSHTNYSSHLFRLLQVWKQKLLWEGFLKCCQRLLPASLGVLIQLPAAQLKDALQICPELRVPLQDYAKSVNESGIGSISQQVFETLVNTAPGTRSPVPDESKPGTEDESPKKEPGRSGNLDEPAPPGME